MRKSAWILAFGIASGACAPAVGPGGSPRTGQARLTQADAKEAAPAPDPLPSTCAAEGDVSVARTKLCAPSAAFTKKLCGGTYPEATLALFAKGTPWTRAYLTGDVDAWNPSAGLAARERLAFDEEVLVLAKHAPVTAGAIVMVGAQATLDILRWDGTCVSVQEGEVTTRRPPAPKSAAIAFRRLDETTRHALLAVPKVKSNQTALEKACASSSSEKSEKARCDRADRAFSQSVADVVRAGTALPTPTRRP